MASFLDCSLFIKTIAIVGRAMTLESAIKSKKFIPNRKQRKLRVITLQEAKQKSKIDISILEKLKM